MMGRLATLLLVALAVSLTPSGELLVQLSLVRGTAILGLIRH
jgi:hypothetical protein